MTLKINRPTKRKGQNLTQITIRVDETTIATLRQLANETTYIDSVKTASLGAVIKALVLYNPHSRVTYKQLNREQRDEKKYMDIKK